MGTLHFRLFRLFTMWWWALIASSNLNKLVADSHLLWWPRIPVLNEEGNDWIDKIFAFGANQLNQNLWQWPWRLARTLLDTDRRLRHDRDDAVSGDWPPAGYVIQYKPFCLRPHLNPAASHFCESSSLAMPPAFSSTFSPITINRRRFKPIEKLVCPYDLTKFLALSQNSFGENFLW